MNESNRERLLRSATEVFLECGYDASIDLIVGHAGVARQTFYNHFESKQSLFSEAMRNCISDILVPLSVHVDDLRDSLKKFALAYRQKALSPQGIAGYRIMTGQAQRFPELTAEAFTHGLGQMTDRLAEFLQQAMDAGKLRKDDASFAAEMLLSMLTGLDRSRLLFGMPNLREEEQLRSGRIVDGFLRMFEVTK